MAEPTDVSLPTWVKAEVPKPLCDVPWLGRAIVNAQGVVSFCCSSPATVGNVNQTPFLDIWRGERMQSIRTALAAQEFPPECQSPACPIWRGDTDNHLTTRLAIGAGRPKQAQRLTGTKLLPQAVRLASGARFQLGLELVASGDAKDYLDVFVALVMPDGTNLFLPSLEPFPVPLRQSVWIGPAGSRTLQLLDMPMPQVLAGRYTLCAALVLVDKNPHLPSHCAWAERLAIEVLPASS